MANVTQSLFPAFGDMLSPSLEQTYAKQFELASRPGDSMQKVSGLISGAGEQFRQGVSGLFGQQPVEFAQRDKLRAIAMGLRQQGVDVTTPEGMLQLAQSLEQFPEYAEASLRLRQQAAMMVQQRQQQELANRLTEAKIGAEAAQAGKYEAEAEKALREPKDKRVAPSSEFVAVGVSLGIPDKSYVGDYTSDEAKQINAEIERRKNTQAAAGASKLTFEGQRNVLGIDEKDAEAYRTARDAARKALQPLSRMQKLLQEGVVTGTGADARVGFLKALNTLGLDTQKANKVISNSEQFNIEVRTLLQAIIKQFGYNPSNADVQFALQSLPNLTNSPQGLTQILNTLVKANKDTLTESDRALSYYRKNKGSFEGFTPNIDIFSPVVPGVKDLTDEELTRQLNAARGNR